MAEFAVLLGLAAAVPLLVRLYFRQLPFAPRCPGCQAMTREVASADPLLSVLASLASTSRRACTRCGWEGRMRWRSAPHRARGGRKV